MLAPQLIASPSPVPLIATADLPLSLATIESCRPSVYLGFCGYHSGNAFLYCRTVSGDGVSPKMMPLTARSPSHRRITGI